MPDGGTLTFDVRNAVPGTADQSAGDHVLIEVIDTGRGMDEATQARAFEPFFSTKGPGHGTGLGLSMVHGFVHQSGGTIRPARAPRARERPCSSFCRGRRRPAARRTPRRWTPLPRGTESVLVVEDNADVRAMVVAQIKSLGYRVAEAESGDAALAVLEARSGRVRPRDLRHGHAGRDRRSGAGQDRPAQRWPRLAILLTTGFADVIVDEAGDGKAVDFGVLRKPYRKADLARAMRAALAV